MLTWGHPDYEIPIDSQEVLEQDFLVSALGFSSLTLAKLHVRGIETGDGWVTAPELEWTERPDLATHDHCEAWSTMVRGQTFLIREMDEEAETPYRPGRRPSAA